MLNKSGLYLNEYGTTQLVTISRSDRTKPVWTTTLEEKKLCRFKTGEKYLVELFSS